MSLELVDGYCHCGVSKYRPIESVEQMMHEVGIARAVLVQHLGEYDNSYLESIVAREPQRFAGVMMIDMHDPSVETTLDYWAEKHIFRGIRFFADTLATHPRIWDQAGRLGLNIVVYQEPTIATYADLLAEFAEAHRTTRLVLSHLGMPNIREAPNYQSHPSILAVARLRNVFVQVSGMHMFANAPYSALVPLMERLFVAFGPRRLLYGSNYPVMDTEGRLTRELDLLRSGRLGVPPECFEQVFLRTAMNLWFGE